MINRLVRHRIARLAPMMAVLLLPVACTVGTPHMSSAPAPQAEPARAARVMFTHPATAPCLPDGLSCDLHARIAAANAYIATRPGVVGYVLRDRVTGGVYRNAAASTPIWTASTIKLAMIADLLTRQRAGRISLTPIDRTHIDQMLSTSDDNAADALWFAYSGPDHMTYNRDFRNFGMTGLVPQRGFSKYFPYWGFQKCTANDLDRLMSHVLDGLNPADRTFIVDRMRTVAPIQQWGVWGAGPEMHPGNKNGWSLEQSGWIANSVGFAGPGERYTLAIMNSLNGQAGFDAGRTTITHASSLLLSGLQ